MNIHIFPDFPQFYFFGKNLFDCGYFARGVVCAPPSWDGHWPLLLIGRGFWRRPRKSIPIPLCALLFLRRLLLRLDRRPGQNVRRVVGDQFGPLGHLIGATNRVSFHLLLKRDEQETAPGVPMPWLPRSRDLNFILFFIWEKKWNEMYWIVDLI